MAQKKYKGLSEIQKQKAAEKELGKGASASTQMGTRPKPPKPTIKPGRKPTGRKKTTRREQVYRQRLITRRAKTRKVRVITRKEQPSPTRGEVTTVKSAGGKILVVSIQEVKRLKQEEIGGPVSSSWIARLTWNKEYDYVEMVTKDGRYYAVFIPFKMYEEWFYAHSKGTYFNYMIRDKFEVKNI